MESMVGENLSEGEEDPELMAGMSATFFDIQLRPIVFFQGYTDLMAKVLLSSGEPTSVVRGNLLLVDHHQVQDGEEAVTCLHTTSQRIQRNEPVGVRHHRHRSRARWHCQMCSGAGKAARWLLLPWQTRSWSCSL